MPSTVSESHFTHCAMVRMTILMVSVQVPGREDTKVEEMCRGRSLWRIRQGGPAEGAGVGGLREGGKEDKLEGA